MFSSSCPCLLGEHATRDDATKFWHKNFLVHSRERIHFVLAIPESEDIMDESKLLQGLRKKHQGTLDVI
jgi:hypothetical protein